MRSTARCSLGRCLLERVELPIKSAVEHLVALQAQEPFDPYYQLWSRLQGFDPAELARLLEERRVVRATSMLRTTIHLMTADDWLALRPVLQVVSDRGFATGSLRSGASWQGWTSRRCWRQAGRRSPNGR